MLKVTKDAVGEGRILLLDLVHTFATRPKTAWRGSYSKVIEETETYRFGLLERIREQGFYVVLLTGRSERYRTVTLANIERHTRWAPDASDFNDLEVDSPIFKGIALHRDIFPAFGSDRRKYFALESNKKTTRLVYHAEGIEVSTFEKWLSGEQQQTLDW